MLIANITWDEVKTNPLMATNKLLDFILQTIDIEMLTIARLVQKSKVYGEKEPDRADIFWKHCCTTLVRRLCLAKRPFEDDLATIRQKG